jgi:uncharacterized membrane protein YkvA (DUF1232 family)
MDTARLHDQIATAIAIEAKEGHLIRYLADRAGQRGVAFGDKERVEALELFVNYLRSVPELLAAAGTAAAGTPVDESMARIMDAAVTYWVEPDDLVPDELGVLGLLDDAYFSLRMLQMVSARLEEETGQILVADDLSALDDVVRDIIGDDLAEILDDLVLMSLSNAPVDELLAEIEANAGTFVLASAQTSFTGLSVINLVEERLSFTARPIARLRGHLIDALTSLASELGAGLSPALVQTSTAAIEAELRATFAEDPNDDDPEDADDPEVVAERAQRAQDLEQAASLLVGGVVQRALLGRPLDREQIAESVEFVLDGLR